MFDERYTMQSSYLYSYQPLTCLRCDGRFDTGLLDQMQYVARALKVVHVHPSHLSFPPASICLFEMTQREEVVVHQISFADVRQFASVTNSVFARDPGTALSK